MPAVASFCLTVFNSVQHVDINADIRGAGRVSVALGAGRQRLSRRPGGRLLLPRRQTLRVAERPDFAAKADHELIYAIIKAVLAHVYIAWIHPFGNGNGRTARLIEFHLLMSGGMPPPQRICSAITTTRRGRSTTGNWIARANQAAICCRFFAMQSREWWMACANSSNLRGVSSGTSRGGTTCMNFFNIEPAPATSASGNSHSTSECNPSGCRWHNSRS